MYSQNKNGYETIGRSMDKQMFAFCDGYKDFLNKCKTERETVEYMLKAADAAGYKPLSMDTSLTAGDKVYAVNRGRQLILAVIGRKPLTAGTNIVASHVDAPRIDLKQNPLYEDSQLALFKTHYYGGIKKYQWTTIPLALHGVIVRGDGSKLNIVIGENADDPVFTITDLLPHLAKDQMDKKMSEGIQGEGLNLLVGSVPSDSEKEKVKNNILKLLKDRYNIEEEDFVSAELEIVPAFMARDVGFDRSLVGGYGQDDRVCAYTSFQSILSAESPEYTAIAVFADKEEIGSMGNTGMKSRFFEDVLAYLCKLTDKQSDDISLRMCLSNSVCLSADVGAAIDPNYKDTHEKNNSPQLNHGIMVSKYTGSRGKAGTSDASAELVGLVRRIFNNNQILWQTGELGKVDQGGGGTVAQYIANLNVDVLDCGTPLLSMHSPFEISSKLDIYMTYKGYTAFLLSPR